MSRLLYLVFLLCVSYNLQAQRPAWSKMSALVREACLHQQSSSLAASSKALSRPVPRLIAFVKTTGTPSDILEGQGCTMLSQRGSLAIASIPLDRIAPLSLDSRVTRIEARRQTRALMDTTAVLLHAPAVYEGLQLPQGYTGKGVVVGIQDIGFDLTHPTFYSADMANYRVKALWDQLSTDTLGSRLPVGRDYTTRQSLLALGHPRDGLTQTHGTHTAGIAAGSGAEGNGVVSSYRGIAYDSDLCLVCNVTGNDIALLNPDDYYKYTFALDALGFQYIFNYADRAGKPCVINFSEGSQEDFMGYDQLYYEMLDSLSGPGHIIVSSAGNGGQNINYVVKPSGVDSAGIFCSSPRNVYATTKSTGDFTLCLTFYSQSRRILRDFPLHEVLAQSDSILRDTFLIDTLTYALSATAYPSSYDSTEMVCDWDISRVDTTFDSGWPASLTLMGRDPKVELFPVIGTLYHSDRDPSLQAGDNSHSINSPSSAPSVICVGATAYRTGFINYLGESKVYNAGIHGQRANFSAVGPTWDGRTKPDVMAPGQNMISSYSSYYLENQPTASDISSDIRHFVYNGRTYAWNSNGGTSMSSPVVAGIIALWLQANPRLTAEDCLRIFSLSCRRPDSTLDYPNNLYGYGEIDAYEGIKAVLGMTPNGIRTLEAPFSASSLIYSLDGRCLGSDTSHLPRGLYIRGGQKFVVGE
ncbi:MAG: S8 family serine peptidase [Prevotella sp.]|nr:S8 family serine peptidase [Prevotella sp.]